MLWICYKFLITQETSILAYNLVSNSIPVTIREYNPYKDREQRISFLELRTSKESKSPPSSPS